MRQYAKGSRGVKRTYRILRLSIPMGRPLNTENMRYTVHIGWTGRVSIASHHRQSAKNEDNRHTHIVVTLGTKKQKKKREKKKDFVTVGVKIEASAFVFGA